MVPRVRSVLQLPQSFVVAFDFPALFPVPVQRNPQRPETPGAGKENAPFISQNAFDFAPETKTTQCPWP